MLRTFPQVLSDWTPSRLLNSHPEGITGPEKSSKPGIDASTRHT